MDYTLMAAFTALANDERFTAREMELRREPNEAGGVNQQIRVATGGERDVVRALEEFAAERRLRCSTIGIKKRISAGAPTVMLFVDSPRH